MGLGAFTLHMRLVGPPFPVGRRVLPQVTGKCQVSESRSSVWVTAEGNIHRVHTVNPLSTEENSITF